MDIRFIDRLEVYKCLIMICFLSIIVSLCCRERPSTLRGGGSIEGGDEAGRKRYLTMHDQKGPINGTEPQDEDQMDQAHLGLSERGQILL